MEYTILLAAPVAGSIRARGCFSECSTHTQTHICILTHVQVRLRVTFHVGGWGWELVVGGASSVE